MQALTLPHARRLEDYLGLIWLGLIIVSWTAAYLIARLVIWIAHGLGALLP